jgi:hypothetical protein
MRGKFYLGLLVALLLPAVIIGVHLPQSIFRPTLPFSYDRLISAHSLVDQILSYFYLLV